MGIGTSLKKLLGGLAPTIGAAIGGPFGGIAMKFLADKFTDGDTGSVEDFLLSADPASLKELKLAEIEFQKTMRELDVDLEEIAYKDRSSAREMVKSKGMIPQISLSAIYTVGYFGVLYMFMKGEFTIQTDHEVMFGGLLGVLSAAQISIMNFFFGSSSGSHTKTDHIAHLSAK